MTYIGINTKGGAGKSTLMSQVLAPYLFQNNQRKANLIEIDDENNDSVVFLKSEIVHCTILPTAQISKIDEIFFDDKDTLVDVGGNKTATIFLKEMKKIQEYENIIWFIPLGAGEQDNQNAWETHNSIKEMHSEAHIIFVLSNVKTAYLEWEFLHFFGHAYLNTEMAIMNQIEDVQYITVNTATIINNSRTFSKTVQDISINPTDFRVKAKKEKDPEKRRKFLFLNRVKNEAVEYMEYLHTDVFSKLDQHLNKKD